VISVEVFAKPAVDGKPFICGIAFVTSIVCPRNVWAIAVHLKMPGAESNVEN
jgi:hypothetical protein